VKNRRQQTGFSARVVAFLDWPRNRTCTLRSRVRPALVLAWLCEEKSDRRQQLLLKKDLARQRPNPISELLNEKVGDNILSGAPGCSVAHDVWSLCARVPSSYLVGSRPDGGA